MGKGFLVRLILFFDRHTNTVPYPVVEAVLDWWNEIPSTAWRKGYEQGYAVGTIVEAMKARGYEAEVVI